MGEELGVKWPCYGEYKCTFCKNAWASSKAWRDFGQKCSKCSDMIKPDSLSVLYYYQCKKCKDSKPWKTKFKEGGSPCRHCKNVVMPVTRIEYMKTRIGMDSLFKDDDHVAKGTHREDLCEKCKQLGRPCSYTGASRQSQVLSNFEKMSLNPFVRSPEPYVLNSVNSRVPVTAVAPLGTYNWNKQSPSSTQPTKRPVSTSVLVPNRLNNQTRQVPKRDTSVSPPPDPSYYRNSNPVPKRQMPINYASVPPPQQYYNSPPPRTVRRDHLVNEVNPRKQNNGGCAIL